MCFPGLVISITVIDRFHDYNVINDVSKAQSIFGRGFRQNDVAVEKSSGSSIVDVALENMSLKEKNGIYY